MLRRPVVRSNAWMGAAAGAAGGLVGSWMMVRFNHLVGGSAEDGDSQPHHRADASPNDTDGTIPDEPATHQVAARASEALLDRPLDEREREYVGPLFHYAFGALAGASYGAIAESQPRITAAAGLPFGATLWVAAVEIGVPAAGLARNPTRYPASRHATALASHLVYALALETVRRLLRGRRNGRQ